MNSYTHIKEALQLAEQAVYQGQMNLDAANFQKAQMHLNMVQQQINEQKEAASGDKELRRMEEHLRHLREAQQAIQQNF
ncbi:MULTISPECIES: hypothetical protein [Priestia]|jgi:hypothetical protein|uniref:DUF2564 family protein n=3 Tax=Priestia TaxID=2800373 RepID=D5E2H2_PRIM1|nr:MULTISPECIES: hypothetical protein [Priestia]AVX07637.1 hypothetical protein CS527_07870 [Bacillus sp. Y-01]KOP73826.1 hypothetical protein AMS61_05535 [Bacillus sp. FJAT-21351]KQU26450.1 hypothetical protein ASG61_00440 [Bacillus sp. Leaf75]KRF53457.1 hypothetical protein ASG98_23500 [Bacillus sp. Soil531]MBZ5478912.1 hypothetical protein [Bacillus sp. T_4]MCJ7986866.1 hypothetical protein [Priestia sp. OVL9]MDH6655512.1 hypothetical protein [Bacillus sp. PvP124]MDP9574338.1 hypothetica